MWITLKDGWRDESTEGSYTETLQTKEGWSLSRLRLPYRSTNDFTLSNADIGLFDYQFDTLEEAKQFVKDYRDTRLK